MKAMILQNAWNKNQRDCIAEFNEARNFLEEIGYEVVSPLEEDAAMENVRHAGIKHGAIWYVKMRLEKLAQCSVVFCLKSAANIPHNQLILMIAESYNIPVLYPSDLQEHKYRKACQDEPITE